MAKKNTTDPEQIPLIDVDDPALKAVKTQITGYEKLQSENREQHAADRKAERDKRQKVLEAVQASNLKPDVEGAYHLLFGGKEWIIRQDSQLKIKKHAIKEVDDAGEDDDGADDIE
jgi:hypothetical protein